MDFDTALKIGKKKLDPFKNKEFQNYLISIGELKAIVPPEASISLGIQDIRVDQIIGTEDRSDDFVDGFFPVNWWMRERWDKVKRLLLAGEINDAIKVFEYGGHYFVRDGHHRTSIAKTNNIEFLTADVTLLKIPINLPKNISRDKFPIFEAKYKFNKKTDFFKYIDEKLISVNQLKTWSRLYNSIFKGHKKWFENEHQYTPNNEELIKSWADEIYLKTIHYIDRFNLVELFDGYKKTDIFCEMISYWNKHPKMWYEDMRRSFIRGHKKNNILKYIQYKITRWWKMTTSSVAEERELFYLTTRVKKIIPYINIPDGPKEWYAFLRDQILISHRKYLKKRLKRSPSMHELVISWYLDLFKIFATLYKEHNIGIPFYEFYLKFMKRWGKLVEKKDKKLSMQKLFNQYIKGT